MPSKRPVHTAVIRALLAVGATACNDDKEGDAAVPAAGRQRDRLLGVPTEAQERLTTV